MSSPSSRSSRSDAISRRLALLSAELAAADERSSALDEPEPLDVPVPAPVVSSGRGRHAAPRPEPHRRPLLRAPETLRGRVRLDAAQLAVVSVVVALGLLLAAWWTVRSRSTGELVPADGPASSLASPAAGSPPVPAAPATAPSPATSAQPPVDGAGAQVVVDVAGKVRHPGIVVLPSGSRVVDALRQAGGARARVDLTALNQARLLVDGEQIVVGRPAVAGVAASAAPSASGSSGSSGSELVNLNTADQPLLEELPGVGPITAEAILDWRTEHGGFTSVDELLEVDGIGDKTLADLAPHVTI